MEPTDIILPTPSHTPDHPSTLLSKPDTNQSPSCQGPVLDQNLSALYAKQPVNDHRDGKGTLQNISSLTDATAATIRDSAITVSCQNVSQPGTLNNIDPNTHNEQVRDKNTEVTVKSSTEVPSIKLEDDPENLAKSVLSQDYDTMQRQCENTPPSGTDNSQGQMSNGNQGEIRENEAGGDGVTEENQISAGPNQESLESEKARQEKIESPEKKGTQRETSLERLANSSKQNEGEQGTKTHAQLKFDTDNSETLSYGTPNKKEDSAPLSYPMTGGSDQQFTSDQQDSEGYYSNRKRAGSSRNESGLSSTEENKVKDEVKKETAPARPKISLDDFHKIAVIGRGSYGEVSLVKKISNNKPYALKAIDKYFMKKERKEHQVYVEKEVLMKSNHPNIIKFYSSFQDKKKLYFVLEYVGGGEFSDYLRAQRKLRKEEIIFFTAEVINILEYLHSNKIAHRDIKPENLLLTVDGHLKCIDFGTAQFLSAKESYKNELHPNAKPTHSEEEAPVRKDSTEPLSHRKTFVGTAQYVSPEMLEHSECDASADFWALGCMIYVMAVGRYPFEETNEFLIFQKIQNLDITYPNDMDPDVKDLVQKLLKKNPHERLGAGEQGTAHDYAALKNHPLFYGIDFATLHKAKAPMADIVSPHRQRDQYTSFPSPAEDPIKKLIPNRKHFLSEDLQTLEEKMGKAPAPAQSRATEVPKERIILSGLVLKKCGWLFFYPRQLVLNSKPRLVYYDPETNQLKGEIPLEKGTVAELESKTKWVINTPKKKYFFKEMEHCAEKWVETVNAVIAQKLQSKQSQV